MRREAIQGEARPPQHWPEWQSTKVAAAYCGLSEVVIRRAVASGALKAGRRGRLLTFHRRALDRFMSGGTLQATSPAGELGPAAPIVIQVVSPIQTTAAPAAAPTTAADRAAQRWGCNPEGQDGAP